MFRAENYNCLYIFYRSTSFDTGFRYNGVGSTWHTLVAQLLTLHRYIWHV